MDTERAERNIKDAAAQAADTVHNGVDRAEREVDETVSSLASRLAALEARWRENGQELLDSAREIGDVAEKQVRAHPLAAFGLAFAAGIIVAKIMRR